MSIITGKDIQKALTNAFAGLTNEKEKIDALNVFPVPDGDTGTNMLLTYTSGYNAIKDLTTDDVEEVMKAFSRGLLMGARGNSGVILSQIFRGMTTSFKGKSTIDSTDFIEALVSARETAYKAVMNPVEGTILTVISDMSKDVYKYKDQTDLKMVMALAIESGEKSLNNTPNLLPVLKEAGVVDSGGYGLMVIFKAIKMYFDGEILEVVQDVKVFDSASVSGESTEFGYCTEFIISLDEEKMIKNKFSEDKLKQQLVKLGDSLVVVHDEDIVKVHVHTLIPGEALNIGQLYGEFLKLKIENMTLQHEEIIRENHNEVAVSDYALISVSPGQGISELFKDNGATNIIDGGQTMNPSTNDFVEIINNANAKNVLILPNNSNIIMAALQAKEIIEDTTDIKVEVVPTKSIIQGLVSLSFFNDSVDIKENLKEMVESYEDVKYGEVTYAVRDTSMNGVDIKAGEFISIFDKKIIESTKDKTSALLNLIKTMTDDETSVITLICGKDITEDEAEEVTSLIEEQFEDYEVELHFGKQDVYSYFVGIE